MCKRWADIESACVYISHFQSLVQGDRTVWEPRIGGMCEQICVLCVWLNKEVVWRCAIVFCISMYIGVWVTATQNTFKENSVYTLHALRMSQVQAWSQETYHAGFTSGGHFSPILPTATQHRHTETKIPWSIRGWANHCLLHPIPAAAYRPGLHCQGSSYSLQGPGF